MCDQTTSKNKADLFSSSFPAENSISCQAELTNISQWATNNNLREITYANKTREIIFYARGHPDALQNTERVSSLKALGITMSMNEHVNTLLDSCARTLYGLRVLRAHGMSDDCIQEVFRATVLAKLVYASPAWSGFCSASDVCKIDRYLNRCKRLNYCSPTTTCITELFES